MHGWQILGSKIVPENKYYEGTLDFFCDNSILPEA